MSRPAGEQALYRLRRLQGRQRSRSPARRGRGGRWRAPAGARHALLWVCLLLVVAALSGGMTRALVVASWPAGADRTAQEAAALAACRAAWREYVDVGTGADCAGP
jgi:ABC-type Fe3+ transport system permease subunit